MNCPICLENFKDAAFSLVCGHLLDEPCVTALKNQRNDRYIVCPICRSRCPADLSAGGIRKIYIGGNAPNAPNRYEYRNNEPLEAELEEYYEEPSEYLEDCDEPEPLDEDSLEFDQEPLEHLEDPDELDEPLYEDFGEYDDEPFSGEVEVLNDAPVVEELEEFYDHSYEEDPEIAAYHEEQLYSDSYDVEDHEDDEDELLIQALSMQEYDE
ncbi:hypothetical protein HYPSUDRAFT_42705 [Hypholoma sublateritium FD-334 SS-4]|uniref:RING-type domain-containing protein n=1 Tax=Hypholoma sublateritium (strain FD-334 SS-4) TaxID=945553 RepID=A0A0D2NWL3_HYPSF|nr:hypothetical protein HYPSUDRAFT_42705 [Hypholoma sublateritium FD-334 SS-4]